MFGKSTRSYHRNQVQQGLYQLLNLCLVGSLVLPNFLGIVQLGQAAAPEPQPLAALGDTGRLDMLKEPDPTSTPTLGLTSPITVTEWPPEIVPVTTGTPMPTITATQVITPTPTATPWGEPGIQATRPTITATYPTTLVERTTHLVDAAGGSFTGLGGRVTIEFPRQAVATAIQLHIGRPDAKTAPPNSPSGQPFRLLAENPSTKQLVTHFDQPVTIRYYFSEAELDGHEANLRMLYYNEEYQRWDPLPGRVDQENNVLIALSDHFSDFDIDTQAWEAALLPTLENFQVSDFTGAATYQLPIWTPPGPGGLQPNLAFSYNSQSVDGATANTQASWVGMGWSLNVAYVQRNLGGTNNELEDDTYSLVVNGVSSLLLPVAETGLPSGVTAFRTADETFWRVWAYDDDSSRAGYDKWVVWTKTGEQFEFGDNPNTTGYYGTYPHTRPRDERATFPVYGDYCTNETNYTWRWPLVFETNVHGQALEYRYDKVWKGYQCSESVWEDWDMHLYPTEIIYPHNRYKVVFQWKYRYDYDPKWDDYASSVFYQTLALDKVQVQHSSDGQNWGAVREYVLEHLSTGQVFPGLVWEEREEAGWGGWPPVKTAGKTLTLHGITERAYNPSTSSWEELPKTTFMYGDEMHLTQASNGYGGQVDYSYERWYAEEGPRQAALRQHFGEWLEPCEYSNSGTGGWAARPGYGTEVTCTSDGRLQMRHVYNSNVEFKMELGETKIKRSLIQPGGMYRVRMQAMTNYVDGYIKLGLQVNGTDEMRDQIYLPWNNVVVTATEYFEIPADVESIKVLVHCYQNYNQYHPLPRCYLPDLFELMMLPTRYRVIEKKLTDQITGAEQVLTYSYDEPAMNDAAHSVWVETEDHQTLYNQAHSEFRGHAMSRQRLETGLSTLTFYHQDDDFAGKPHTSITVQETFFDLFDTLNTSKWLSTGSSTKQIEMHSGDDAMAIYNPSANWNQYFERTNPTIAWDDSSNMAMVTFRIEKDDTQDQPTAVLAVDSGDYYSTPSTYKRWGFLINANGSVTTHMMNGQSYVSFETISSPAITKDNWYVAMLIVGKDEFLVRIWQRDHPENAIWSTCPAKQSSDPCYFMRNQNWHFQTWISDGVLRIDNYLEGTLHQLNHTFYTASTTATPDPMPKVRQENGSLVDANDLGITWSRTTAQSNYTFVGADYSATRTEYKYLTGDQGGTLSGLQFGNLSRIETAQWVNGAWEKHQLTKHRYFPYKDNAVYLVGLLGVNNTYTCSGATCVDDSASILTSQWVLYDQQTAFGTPPTTGIPTGQRVLLSGQLNASGTAIDNKGYRDTTFTYDAWGNQTGITVYNRDNDWEEFGQGAPLTTETFYDPVYHTYPVAAQDAQGKLSFMAYDYSLGVPIQVVAPNGAVTTATYDGFGRLRTVCQAGDDCTTSPTTQLSYHDSKKPFYTVAIQKSGPTTNLAVRKIYNGLGQLLQVQNAKVRVDGADVDILVDTGYDAVGRVISQTVPYIVPNWTARGGSNPFVAQTFAQDQTNTTYDRLNRPVEVTAPDGAQQFMTYGLLETTVTDARVNSTTSLLDVWGQVIGVQPPTGPSLSYEYDALGRLISVTKTASDSTSAFETSLTYDYAGRKIAMDDPDMGEWSYSYNALGQLITQTDARSCTQQFSYDALGRLVQKTYTGTQPTCYETSPVTYIYDGLARHDTFGGSGLPDGWGQGGSVSVSGGTVTITGDGTWASRIYKAAEDQFDGAAVQFDFQISGGGSQQGEFFYKHGEFGTSGYRRWGFQFVNGWLKLSEYVGTVNTGGQVLMAYSANTWYEGLIVADGRTGFRLVVWEQANPAKWAVYQAEPEDWDGRSWQFVAVMKNGTVQMDNYREFEAGALGQRSAIQDGSGETGWHYDGLGRPVSEQRVVVVDSTPYTFTTAYGGYDNAGKPGYMQYPGGPDGSLGEQISYTYNQNAQLSGISGADTYVSSIAYDYTGRITQLVRGSSVLTTDFTYYPWDEQGGRLSTIATDDLQNLTYTYDVGGNILAITDTIAAETLAFTYDSLNRLESFLINNTEVETYTFDSQGRLLSKVADVYTYPNDAPVHAAISLGTNTYAYDENGNMRTRNVSEGSFTLTHNAENRLVQITGPFTTTYIYDGDQNLVVAQIQTTDTVTTTIYTGNYYEYEAVDTISGTEVLTTSYYYAGSTRVAMRRNSVLAYILSDHLGSSSLTTDASGIKTSEQKYMPYGKPRGSGRVGTDYTFTGQRSYSQINLTHMGARWYAPELGAFIQADTIVPLAQQGVMAWNRYAYVNFSPINFRDPSGHWLCGDQYDPACAENIDEQADFVKMYAVTYDGTALESWAATSDYVAGLVNNDVDQYMGIMDRVFGHQGNGLNFEISPRDCIIDLCGIKNPDGSWVSGPTSVYQQSTINERKFQNSSGFSELFADPNPANNQVHHTYFGFQLGYYHGLAIAAGANFNHEFLEGRQNGPWPRPGQSIGDYRANNSSLIVGNALHNGWLKPEQIGNVIRKTFSDNYLEVR